MMRVFYDPQTGQIKYSITKQFADPNMTLPFIDITNPIKINEWRVNIETQQLEAQTPLKQNLKR